MAGPPESERPSPWRWLQREWQWLLRRGGARFESLHDAVLSAYGRIDILVNSAGTILRKPALECEEEEWARVMETNLTGTLRACQIFGKTMVKQG